MGFRPWCRSDICERRGEEGGLGKENLRLPVALDKVLRSKKIAH